MQFREDILQAPAHNSCGRFLQNSADDVDFGSFASRATLKLAQWYVVFFPARPPDEELLHNFAEACVLHDISAQRIRLEYLSCECATDVHGIPGTFF